MKLFLQMIHFIALYNRFRRWTGREGKGRDKERWGGEGSMLGKRRRMGGYVCEGMMDERKCMGGDDGWKEMYGRGGWMKGYVWEGRMDERKCMWGAGDFLNYFSLQFSYIRQENLFHLIKSFFCKHSQFFNFHTYTHTRSHTLSIFK